MGNGYDMQSMIQLFEEMMGMSLSAYLVSEIPTMLVNLAIYVFTALALYTMAKRRGINNPWLAWIPFANTWLLGCVSDQYRAVARGETKYRRRVLLITEIATSIIATFVVVLCFVMLGRMFAVMFEILGIGIADLMDPEKLATLENMMDSQISDAQAQKLLSAIMGPGVGMVLLALALIPVAIVYMVFSYIALHDIYKSCDPSNATLYLVLSILIGYAQPVFLFLCRNKDGGMPMRQEPQPAYIPYEPTCDQPATPPVEPWEQKEE